MSNPAPSAELHRSDKPVYKVDTLEDLLMQIVGDPACRRQGCNGRGFFCLRHNEDKSITVMLCSCGSYGYTETVRLLMKMQDFVALIGQGIDKHHEDLVRKLQSMENHRRLSDDLNYDHMKRIESVTVVGAFRRAKRRIADAFSGRTNRSFSADLVDGKNLQFEEKTGV